MTDQVGSATLVQSATGTKVTPKTKKKSSSGCGCCKCNSVFTQNNRQTNIQTRQVAYTPAPPPSSGGCGFWSKIGSGLKSFVCGVGNVLAGTVKVFGGALGFLGKAVGGFGAVLGSSNLGFAAGAGLGAYGLYNSIGFCRPCGFGGFGFGGWPFMTTSGFYRPLCFGVGGWGAPAHIAGRFPNMLGGNHFGAANVLGFDFGAFGNRPLGMHASQNPLQHYWRCGAGGRSVFGFG